MQITEGQTDLLKAWVVKRLDDVSDADSDVLADYVLALVKSDEPDAQIKANCLENLEDFLKEHTAQFVDDVFGAITSESYDPSRPPKPVAPASGSLHSAQRTLAANSPSAKKRSFQADDVEMYDDLSSGARGGREGERYPKQARRGANGYDGRGARHTGNTRGNHGRQPQMPDFDPSNPMSALLAMQAMMNMPGMPTMPSNADGTSTAQGNGQRCQDYDQKGFCALGAACPFEHGNDHLVVPSAAESYDPNNPMFAQGQNGRYRGRGRGDARDMHRGARGNRRGNRGGRADFSHAGPSHDRSNTSVVVENIPQDKFSTEAVQEFFGEFGTIEDITLQEFKSLAIIKFADYDGAKQAYDSPKVIFDNRFVKVYWYKPEGLPRPRNGQKQNGGDAEAGQDVTMQDSTAVDPVELAKRQAEAQVAHEAKMVKLNDARQQREALDAKIKAQEQEREALMAKLAAKSGTKQADPANGETVPDAAARAKTEALKAKLAALENDARKIGIDPNEVEQSVDGSYRGRGGYRGRFAGRGRGRGRGRGEFGAARGGAVMRLDNRPRTVLVVLPAGKEMGSDVDEALKQFLLFVSISASVTFSGTNVMSVKSHGRSDHHSASGSKRRGVYCI